MTTTPPDPDATWTSTFEVEGPDISDLVIEDDEPVDNIYSEKQQRLLTSTLYDSWPGPRDPDGGPEPFLAAANVGVFATAHDPPLVPDVLVSVEVAAHPDLPHDKRHQTYFIWEFGKPPDVVIEIVSNRKGGELGRRKRGYERMRVMYFVVWDPERLLKERELMAYVLGDAGYAPMTNVTFQRLGGLGLRPWEGVFEGLEARWLRWFDGEVMLPTGGERARSEETRADAAQAQAEAAQAQAEAAQAQADAAQAQADAAQARAEALEALLRAHGITPEG